MTTRRSRSHLPWFLLLAAAGIFLAEAADAQQCTQEDPAVACTGSPPVDCSADDHFTELVDVGDLGIVERETPWLGSRWIMQRVRGESEINLGIGYDVQFPMGVLFNYDPEQVAPGGTFEVTARMAPYDSSDLPDEYSIGLPGLAVSARFQRLIFDPFKPGWRWITIATFGYDFLLASDHDFDDEHFPALGDERISFDSDIGVPVPLPGFWQLVELLVTLNLRFKHEMQNREVVATASVEPNPNQGEGDAEVDTDAVYLFDEDLETHAISVTLPEDYCHNEVRLNLESCYEYGSRGHFLPVLQFFPGTAIEFEFERKMELQHLLDILDQVGLGDYTFFPNFWDANSTPQLVIPVMLKPDLCVNDLGVVWESVTIQEPCYGNELSFQYPVLRAEIENCGCTPVSDDFHVKFVGVNHGVALDEVLFDVSTSIDPGQTITVDSGPIVLWDRKLRVVADSKEEIDEMDETNNTAEVDLAEPLLAQSGFQVYDPTGGLLELDLPVGFTPGHAGLLTPFPESDSTSCDYTSGPVPVRDADPGLPDFQLALDFSYFYDQLDLRIALPDHGVSTPFPMDPGAYTITLPPSPTNFSFDVYDNTGVTKVATETVQLLASATAPSLSVSSPPPSVTPSHNVSIAGTAPDATQVACSVSARGGSVLRDYGPYTLTSPPAFACNALSLLEGDNDLTVTATNQQGERATWTGAVELDPLYDAGDTVPPEVHFSYPEYSSASPCEVHITDPTPTIRAVVSDFDPAVPQMGTGIDALSVKVEVDGQQFDLNSGVEFDSSGALAFQVPSALSDSQHTVTIEAKDYNNNLGSKTTIFCVDTVPPGLTAVATTPLFFEPRHEGAQEFPPELDGWPPPPASTPLVAVGSLLSGTLFNSAEADGYVVADTEFRGVLLENPPGAASGTAAFRQLQYPSPLDPRRVMVISVEGAAADTSYPISVNGQALTGVSLLTDGSGAGMVQLDDAAAPTPPVYEAGLGYTISEDAAVTVSVYAGTAPPGQEDEAEYRITLYKDGFDSLTNERLYSPAGTHSIAFDGTVPSAAPNVGETDSDAYFELDTGLHHFVVEATDRAGNTSTASANFTVNHSGRVVSSMLSDFSVDATANSGCNAITASVELRDAYGGLIPNRLVGLLPTSDRNDFNAVPPVIDDFFFTGGMRQGASVSVPTNGSGSLSFPVQGASLGWANVSVDYLPVGATAVQIGTPQAFETQSPLCSNSVSTANSSAWIAGTPYVCQPFVISVELRDGSDALLEDVNVSVRAESDRNVGGSTVDFFFDPGGPQGGFTPVYTGSELIETTPDPAPTDVDTRGKFNVPVIARKAGTANFTIWLRTGATESQLATASVEVFGGCTELPDPTQSSAVVSPSTITAGQQATLTLALRDAEGEPIPDTTFAVQPTSDRNDSASGVAALPDLFGAPPSASRDFTVMATTDANGEIAIPVRSIEAGQAVLGARIVSPFREAEIPGDANSTLTVSGLAADAASPTFSDLSVIPGSPGEVIVTITLRDGAGNPLADALVGLWIRSSRNEDPATAYAIDHVFEEGGSSELPDGVVPLTTDGQGQIQLSVRSSRDGTSELAIEVLATSGLGEIVMGPVSFNDADGDDVPDSADVCPGFDDGRDCDLDGIPDGCDTAVDDIDGDGISDFCDNCPSVANPAQEDSYGSNLGDACETVLPHQLVMGFEVSLQADVSGSVALSMPAAAGGILSDPKFTHTPFSASFADPSLRIEGSLGTGTLASILQEPLTDSTLPVYGLLRVCLLNPGCVLSLPVPLTVNGTSGVGLGGIVAASGFGIGVSIEGAPWTIGTASVTNVLTSNSGLGSFSDYGFGHTPGSGAPTIGGTGTVKLVTPIRVTTTLPGVVVGGFATLTIQFVPEPGLLPLLGAGLLGLAVLGFGRMKR